MSIRRLNAGPRMSQATVHGGLVYTSGQVDASAPDVATQTKQVLAKIDSLLAQAGTDKSRILTANIWLANVQAFAEMNGVWESWVTPETAPARATVESKLAGPEYKVEVSVVAALRGERN